MQKYVIANRLSKNKSAQSELSSHQVHGLLSGFSKIPSEFAASATNRVIAIVDVSAPELEFALKNAGADIIIEPLIMHWPSRILPRDLRKSNCLNPNTLNGINLKSIRVHITGGGYDLSGTQVRLFIKRFGAAEHIDQITDVKGLCIYEVPHDCDVVAAVALPRYNYWHAIARGLSVEKTIDCPACRLVTLICGGITN